MPVLDDVVARILDGARRPAVVVTDLDVQVDVVDTVVRRIGEPLPEHQLRMVLLVTRNAETLRTDVSRIANLRWSRMVGCVLAEADAVATLRAHPSWPGIDDLDARLEQGAATTRIDFRSRLEVAPVLLALARSVAAPVRTGPGGLRVAGAVAPPADPTYVGSYDVEDERPPDVVLGDPDPTTLPSSPVLGRAPTRVGVGELDVPLDEAVYNPIGFRREWTRGMVDLPAGTRLDVALVRGLRDAQGARLANGHDPRLAAGLAMCGIPTEQIEDPAERERHSVRTRRAALTTHSTLFWRARLAERAGVRFDPFPAAVSVTSSGDPDEDTDLRLALHYSGADLVVIPDDAIGPTETYVATPPPGSHAHRSDRTPDEIVASGGLVYATRPRSVG
jgi:hypothetical protein